MRPRIAIPEPCSFNPEYVNRALPEYEQAVAAAGGDPVRIPLDQKPAEVMKLISRCDGVLLPGSRADVDPEKYGATRDPQTAPADSKRDTVDELLLQDAFNMKKPVLGICYGLQILNVYRSGTLVQHIESAVQHEAGRTEYAHRVRIEPGSRLGGIVGANGSHYEIAVNSSHHQAAEQVGDGLRVVARSAEDGMIEALEGTSPEHYVIAVQWHPERAGDEASRLLFASLVEAARQKHAELAGEFEGL